MSDLTLTRFVSTRQPAGRSTVASSLAAIRVALRTYMTRQALPQMTARELSDVGLTQHAALAEAARLPWDTNRGPRPPASPGVLADLQKAWHRARTRRLLAEMTARELRDIGVTRLEAETECNKPFWHQ
jgi:uncharacterized protein YjiS (DUF1127 family)